MPIEDAINKAIDYAISNNYLDGFFEKHREEIMHICMSEFNEEPSRKGIQDIKSDSTPIVENRSE